ncbi:hypothetical protein SADUNF_Sadunf18G0068600 [Salix dunnii]|uniref:Uncharacterized protein n=1 Tax=Salix dunnii TaxID=1413687 RepID=A0A835J4E0_9ROSI|nr:hypothetical protein SADUNF_Sadunf18G0068600 [Salix dunnii]
MEASVEVSLSIECHFKTINCTTKSSLSYHASVSNTFSRCTGFDLGEALILSENLSQQLAYSNSLLPDMPPVLATGKVVCMKGFESGVDTSTGLHEGLSIRCGHVYKKLLLSLPSLPRRHFQLASRGQ